MKFILLHILIIITLIGYAQTTVTVFAPAYKGKYALLNTSEDLVTYNNNKIDKQLIDTAGYFSFTLTTDKVLKTYIEIGSTSTFLYIDPTTSLYKVYFPSAESNSQKITGNTVELLFDGLAKNDINTLILELNYRIDDFLFGDSLKMQRTILQDDAFKDSINAFKKVLIKEYGPIKKQYFHEYIKYSIAGLEQLYIGRGIIKNKIYLFEMYLNNLPILYQNDAYMDFFKQNFDGFFHTNIGLYDRIEHAINDFSSAEKLDEVLVNSPFLKNDSIRELATIVNLYRDYYKKNFNQNNIISVLEQIKKKSTIKEHQTILKNIFFQINLLKQNSLAPEINLITTNFDTITISEFKGKYVYIQFFATWNQTALQELKIMEDMYSKYNKYIEFISISLDEDEQEFVKFKKAHPNYKWHFAHYKGENSTLLNYNITSVPNYVLIDEKGNIEEAQAMSPAPNYPRPSIDKTFFYIKKKKEPKNTRTVGGKGN